MFTENDIHKALNVLRWASNHSSATLEKALDNYQVPTEALQKKGSAIPELRVAIAKAFKEGTGDDKRVQDQIAKAVKDGLRPSPKSVIEEAFKNVYPTT